MPGGRPTKYKEEYIAQAKKLTAIGLTDKQIANIFNVSEVTINAWKKKYPEFLKSLKKGKKISDDKVERSLFERATGYEHVDTKFATYEGEITDTKEYMKHYPPDTTAIIFWLKNRRPDQWRDKQEIEHSGKIGKYESMSDKELEKKLAMYEQRRKG